MTNKEILSVALKVFAIYVLTNLLVRLPGIYGAYAALKSEISEYQILVPCLLVLGSYVAAFLLAWTIWKLSKTLVATVGDDEQAQVPGNLGELVIMAVGLFIAIDAVFTFPSAMWDSIREMRTSGESGGLSGGTVVWAVSVVLKGVLGFTLIVKPEGWLGIIRRLRTSP